MQQSPSKEPKVHLLVKRYTTFLKNSEVYVLKTWLLVLILSKVNQSTFHVISLTSYYCHLQTTSASCIHTKITKANVQLAVYLKYIHAANRKMAVSDIWWFHMIWPLNECVYCFFVRSASGRNTIFIQPRVGKKNIMSSSPPNLSNGYQGLFLQVKKMWIYTTTPPYAFMV
jgi:hypothetical protein